MNHSALLGQMLRLLACGVEDYLGETRLALKSSTNLVRPMGCPPPPGSGPCVEKMSSSTASGTGPHLGNSWNNLISMALGPGPHLEMNRRRSRMSSLVSALRG